VKRQIAKHHVLRLPRFHCECAGYNVVGAGNRGVPPDGAGQLAVYPKLPGACAGVHLESQTPGLRGGISP